jgi:tetratricopeptide (TPR) repeat protein
MMPVSSSREILPAWIGWAKGLAQLERAAALARAEGDTTTSIMTEVTGGYCLRHLGRGEVAVRVLEAVASLAEEHDTEESLQLPWVLAEAYLETGRLEQARTQLAHALAIYQRLGNTDMLAFLTARLGESYVTDGDWLQARHSYEQALQLREAKSHFWGAIVPLARFGELAFREGRWADAKQLLDEAMRLSQENQDWQWLWLVHDLLIERDLLRGQVEAAFARHTALMADPDQAAKLAVFPSPALAMAHLAAGDVDRADELVEGGIQFLGESGLDLYLWVWIALRARVLAARERWAESEAAFDDAIARTRRTR